MARSEQARVASEAGSPGASPHPAPDVPKPAPMPVEHGGPAGPEPTRFGDWEQKGRCSDF